MKSGRVEGDSERKNGRGRGGKVGASEWKE